MRSGSYAQESQAHPVHRRRGMTRIDRVLVEERRAFHFNTLVGGLAFAGLVATLMALLGL